MTPRNTSTTHLDLAGGTIAACLLASLAYVSLAPALREREQISARRLELASLQRETDAALDSLRATRRLLADSRARAESMPVRLRSRAELNSRIAEIIAQIDAHELSMVTILPGDPTPGDRYTRTPIEMSIRGGASDLARYLHELHEREVDLEITNMTISTSDVGVDVTIRADWITLTP